ncbi:enoyl-CoA hydratase/isomerase family protein [Rhodococcus sp. T2V]|uniref:enoyl-CoA hydratase/isomerase family protein n=1 Tax=Rhodococcus sp. T2V TaxID=3034164 RepID=UPI0023E25899|nr:enoyl-CoA hydratase/isomerase family protein [Rhodococcus sp. T2V]MDF3312327.1 enoyl-CoA hydratase/isomerase family protein [Rhodococcus sp. T2V]
MTGGPLAHHEHGDALELVLDRESRRNALSRDLLRALRNAFTNLPEGVRAVVLTGTGPVFSAGADFADLTGTAADLAYDQDLDGACAAIRHCPVPVVAAVAGPCVGAAVELAISCDARFAGSDAWFRVPAVELGLLYNPTSIRRIHATLPRSTVTRLLVFAERFDAEEAVRSGLATHLTDGDPREHALALARTLAQAPHEALTATRALLRHLDDGSFEEAEWQATRTRLLDSPARHAAVAAASARHGTTAP